MTVTCLACVVRPRAGNARRDVERILNASRVHHKRHFAGHEATWFGVGARVNLPNVTIRLGDIGTNQRLYGVAGDGLPIDPRLGLDWLVGIEQTLDRGPCGFSRRFVVAGWDCRTGELLVARDPLGLEPVFYAVLPGGGLGVASRAKALLSLDDVSRNPDPETCAEALLSLPRRRGATFFTDVKELPRGSLLRFGQRGLEIVKYFELAPDREMDAGTSHSEMMANAMRASVRKSLWGALLPAVTLSGGLDSSSVFRLAHPLTRGQILPITAIFPGDHRANEDEYLQCALRGTGSRTVKFEPKDHPIVLQTCLEEADDPQWIPLASITLASAHVARTLGVDRLLTGQFGDFVGGRIYGPISWLMARGYWDRAIRESLAIGGTAPRCVSRIIWQGLQALVPAMRLLRARRQAECRNASRLLRSISPRIRARFDLGARLRRDWLDETDPLRSFEGRAERFLDNRTNRICGSGWLAERLYGIVVEHPFMDVPLFQIATQWNFEDCWADGLSRSILRLAMKGTVPGEILARRSKADFQRHHLLNFERIRAETQSDDPFWPVTDLLELSRLNEQQVYNSDSIDSALSMTLIRVSAAWLRTIHSAGATE